MKCVIDVTVVPDGDKPICGIWTARCGQCDDDLPCTTVVLGGSYGVINQLC